MDNTLKYWQFVRLHASGKRQVEQMPAAQSFFEQQFPPEGPAQWSDAAIQRRLFDLMQTADGSGVESQRDRDFAECCLRCCISHIADWTCRDLETQFGQMAGLTWADLYSQVLDDFTRVGRRSTTSSEYESVASRILRSFDPAKGQLNTWTKRLVIAELNPYLLDCGIYLVSDWALLNSMTPDRWRRLCNRTYRLPEAEIHLNVQLLTAFHAIYRRDRLNHTTTQRRTKCLPPDAQQLEEMVSFLVSHGMTRYSTTQVLQELQGIAQRIRQTRRPQHISLDNLDTEIGIDKSNNPDLVEQSPIKTLEDQEENQQKRQFLQQYRKDLEICLEQALAAAVEQRLDLLHAKDPAKKTTFLKALCLYHCLGYSMGNIGKELNLGSQPTVSRLMKLDALRADVRQRLLLNLRAPIRALASTYTDQEQLEAFDRQLETILIEQVDPILAEAIAEGSTAHRPRKSLFAVTLCRHLHTQNIEPCAH